MGPRSILVTGGTGYLGQRLIPVLAARGHRVRGIVRQASAGRLPAPAAPVVGDALDTESLRGALAPGDTLVHLVGTPRPSPAKAAQFQAVDLPSIRASVAAASQAGCAHLVYVSVARPAPILRAYQAVRQAGEEAIAAAGLTATVLRPWYVLGPGHLWPVALIPLYALAELLPATRAGARRLGLVTRPQMVAALVRAVEEPPGAGQVRVVDVPAIRASRL